MASYKTVSISMLEDTRNKIAAIAKHTGLSQQKLYRTALDSYANNPHVPPVDLTPFVDKSLVETIQPTTPDDAELEGWE